MDFIIKLPESEGKDMITIIMDRFTKYVYLESSNKIIDAADMIYLLLKTMIANHRVPEKITSN